MQDAPRPLGMERRVVPIPNTHFHSTTLDQMAIHLQPLDDNMQQAGNHQLTLFPSTLLDHLANASQLSKISTISIKVATEMGPTIEKYFVVTLSHVDNTNALGLRHSELPSQDFVESPGW
ncbi:hypothetical protein VNO78_23103 [Psophocarpus tetragonolobus]|uniref:Uncharacterized protein n=1 Tax=Psophocarpus tetragonolobus TaxID=3891 RepID=A0AAN9XE54_PSOTE